MAPAILFIHFLTFSAFAISPPQTALPEIAMPLLLAPYNNAMRLGMGFNSYTQKMCIDSAVEATDETMISSETLPPKITSSSRLFERVSEVVDTMDISRAATITTGELEVHEHTNALNHAEIDNADINLLVSVRVMSKITSLKGSARFRPIDGMEAGSPRFNETFGDSYISGFITGGLLTSIISFIGSDPDRKDKLIEAVKKGLTESTMDLENVCKEFAITSVVQGVEVEDINCATDVASILRIAGEFPTLVSQDPQNTWAILTKYKANRSFNEWSAYQILKPLDYDSVASYTSKLFDNYIQYNHLSKKVQGIISQRDQYSQVDKPRAIPVELNTLLATRSALDREINKIVAVVNTLTRHPELLPQIDLLNANLKDGLVQDIFNEATLESSRPISQQESTVQEDPFLPSVADYAPSELSSGVDGLHTPRSSDVDSSSTSGRTLVFRDETEASTDLVLIPPEVWVELLPVKVKPDTANRTKVTKFQKLEIIAAVCGIHDVTDKLRGGFLDADQNGHRLTLNVENIKRLEDRDSSGDFVSRKTTNLSIAYKYTDGPIRVCSVEHDEDSVDTFEITTKSKHPRAQYHPACTTGLRILCVIYGGKIYNDFVHLDRFAKHVDRSNPGSWPRIQFNKDTVGDELLGKPDVTGVVFYQYLGSSVTQAAVSMGGAGCLLTDQRQLAKPAGGMINGVPHQATKRNMKKDEPQKIVLGEGVKPERLSCTFEPGTLLIRPSESPFLQFENGVKFIFQKSGTFEVLNENNEVLWSIGGVPEDLSPGLLEFGKDGRLRLWTTEKHVYWSPLQARDNCEGRMVLSSQWPYLVMFNSRSERLWIDRQY